MKTLIDNAFVAHYGITSFTPAVEYNVQEESFDIDDKSTLPIVEKSNGQVTLSNISGGVDVLSYEHFINGCKRPRGFANGLKRCDYVITSATNKSIVCLLEITSAVGSVSGLSIPILHSKTKAVIYPGGKYEKVQDQLESSLKTLMDVPAISSDFQQRIRKVCLMAYRIYPYTKLKDRIRHPFMRFLGIEARETKEQGAWFSCPGIESYGFEYRRINHDYTFIL